MRTCAPAAHPLQVSLRTLDDVLASLPRHLASPIHTVKMDVEGMECSVVAGATSLFDPSNPSRPRFGRFEVALDEPTRPQKGSKTEACTRALAERSGYRVAITGGFRLDWSRKRNAAYNPEGLMDRTAFLERAGAVQRTSGARHDA